MLWLASSYAWLLESCDICSRRVAKRISYLTSDSDASGMLWT